MLRGRTDARNIAEAIRLTGATRSTCLPVSSWRRATRIQPKVSAFVKAARVAGAENARTALDDPASPSGLLTPIPFRPRRDGQFSPANSFLRSGPDERGRFGIYGGRFVSETLMPLILDLEGIPSAKADPAVLGRDGRSLEHYVGRPAALFRRAADRASRRREDLLQARRAEPYRQPQDQQRAGPDPARPPHGQDPDHRRDRRRPARRRDRDGLRPLRLPAWSSWARRTSSARRPTSSA